MSTEPPCPTRPSHARQPTAQYDVIIVGAGFAGLYQLHRLRSLGMTAKVIEAGSGVGGTWYWNRYPGARCDVESMQYSYAFSEELQQEWQWPELFSAQPDILKYANHVADKLDLRRDILFDTRVTEARFDETTSQWSIRTNRGDTFTAGFMIMATGCLSTARVPDFKGLDTFKGKTYHTGAWPHEGVDFTGMRVGDHRHRVLRHPGHPGDRRAGRRSDRVPAHAELLHPLTQRSAGGKLRAALERQIRRNCATRPAKRATASSPIRTISPRCPSRPKNATASMRNVGHPAARRSWRRSTI